MSVDYSAYGSLLFACALAEFGDADILSQRRRER
jgi:hypothetical protein